MKNETLKVTGMTCDGCSGKVAHALKALAGVHDVVVSLAAREATVRYDEHLTSLDQLKSAVKGAGYGVDTLSIDRKPEGKSGCCG